MTRIDATDLVRLVAPAFDGAGPRYRVLADALAAAAARGDITPGTVLPPERTLARALGVARGTVAAALDLLEAKGLVERRQGSGTRWLPTGDRVAPPPIGAGLRAGSLVGRLVSMPGAMIDLGVSLLPDPVGLPDDAFRFDVNEVARVTGGHGYHPLGVPALRAGLAELHTAEGLPTDPSQILVTGGAQQALALVGRTLLERGDLVAVESPTYPAAIDAFARVGAQFVSVTSDSAGAQPESVRRVLASKAVRLVSLVPTAHNPTGTIMPPARRHDIAALVGATDTWLVEDESLRWAAFERARPPLPIAATGGDRVITVGSLSKVLWGGLRLGWLRADSAMIERIGRLKAADDLGTSALSQAVAIRLLDRLDEVAALRRRQLSIQADLLCALLAVRLPEWSFRPPDGGLSLWVRLPRGSGDAFARTALAHGVGVLAGSVACVDDAGADRIRLSFALDPEVLASAVERLAEAWSAFNPGIEGLPPAQPRSATPLG